MRVADHPDVLAARPEFHGDHRFGNQLGGERPDDVHPEYGVRIGIREEFHQAARVAERPRPGIGHEREGAGTVGDAFGLQLLLGFAHPRDLGRGVDHPGDGIEIHVRVLPGDALGHGHALLLRLVREHRPAHHVADRPHASETRAAVLVHDDEAALGLDADATIVAYLRVVYAGVRDAETVDKCD